MRHPPDWLVDNIAAMSNDPYKNIQPERGVDGAKNVISFSVPQCIRRTRIVSVMRDQGSVTMCVVLIYRFFHAFR